MAICWRFTFETTRDNRHLLNHAFAARLMVLGCDGTALALVAAIHPRHGLRGGHQGHRCRPSDV